MHKLAPALITQHVHIYKNLSNAQSDFVAEIMVPRLYRDRKRMAQAGTEGRI